MSQDAAQTQAEARNFVLAARAIENWNLVELREAWGLPEHMPLEPLADLLARVYHLPVKSRQSIEEAIRASPAHDWVQRAGVMQGLVSRLPAICAFVGIDDAAVQLHGVVLR